MEGPLGVGMPRTEGDTQEVDFFSPQALLESYRAMSEDSVHCSKCSGAVSQSPRSLELSAGSQQGSRRKFSLR